MRSISVIIFLASFSVFSQERNLVWEQNIALNYDFKNWDLNTTIGSRTTWEELEEEEKTLLEFLEINQFFTRKVSSNKKLSAGYKYRAVEPSESEKLYEHRFTQQLAWTHLNNRIRLISRFRTEQRVKTSSFEHRYRYRFSVDLPLGGEKLNVGEFYALSSNELLFSEEEGDTALDNRFTLGLGFLAAKTTKIQIDFTYRAENLFRQVENVPFLTSSIIFNLKD